jgi:Rrf2 family protein
MVIMSKIFSMSEAASIAIHSMVLIARNKDGINAVKIAEQTGFSKNHISKVAQRLVKNDLIKSMRGPAGGFSLKKRPVDITLLEIYQSIEGPIEITDCPLVYEVCHFDQCVMGNVVNQMTLEFKRFLNKQTLQKYL